MILIRTRKVIHCRFQNGTPIQVNGLFDVSVLNGLWTMLAGHRFALNDAKLEKLMELTHVSFRMLDMSGGILNQLPLVRFLAPKCSGYRELQHILKEFYTFLKVRKLLRYVEPCDAAIRLGIMHTYAPLLPRVYLRRSR